MVETSRIISSDPTTFTIADSLLLLWDANPKISYNSLLEEIFLRRNSFLNYKKKLYLSEVFDFFFKRCYLLLRDRSLKIPAMHQCKAALNR